jgi:predicted amidophosphoribosyltransferase
MNTTACYFVGAMADENTEIARGLRLLAIFIPNALGIVLYFVLRKPRIANCPQCGAVVEPGFGFCPQCRHRLTAVCPRFPYTGLTNTQMLFVSGL